MSDPRALPPGEADPRHDLPLQLASRLVALLRSGRAWSLEHVTFTGQLENYVLLLEPALADLGVVRLDAPEGDVRMNGVRLPWRPRMERALEQLAQEFEARGVEGVEFQRGVTLAELQRFMRYFLPGELWKGEELLRACDEAGLEHVRALPLRPAIVPRPARRPAGEPLAALGAARPAWSALEQAACELLAGDALEHGVELRHVKRRLQPVVDAVLAGDGILAALSRVAPGEPGWAHAAHTALLAIGVGARLGLARADLSSLGLAALLHDAGHDWGGSEGGAPHTLEGVRRLAWATTLNRDSLAAMRVSLEHHAPADAAPGGISLVSQVVAIADAYVSNLSRGGPPAEWISPGDALARVLWKPAGHWHPALPAALVLALGLHPPGQLVELDDGSIARALVPDPAHPERPRIEWVLRADGHPVTGREQDVRELPEGRRIVRPLPRGAWPEDSMARDAA